MKQTHDTVMESPHEALLRASSLQERRKETLATARVWTKQSECASATVIPKMKSASCHSRQQKFRFAKFQDLSPFPRPKPDRESLPSIKPSPLPNIPILTALRSPRGFILVISLGLVALIMIVTINLARTMIASRGMFSGVRHSIYAYDAAESALETGLLANKERGQDMRRA